MTTLERTMPPQRPDRLFSVAEYLRMVELGILTKYDKVELIDGRIVEKMPTNPEHEGTLQRIHVLLMKSCPPQWMVRTEAPLQLEKSTPEPDAMIVQSPVERYDHQHPCAGDALLVVEVSNTTLRYDRSEKIPLYAAAAIPFYWIVNLIDRQVEMYSDPTGPDDFPTYRIRRDVDENSSVTLAFPEHPSIEMNVKDMLSRKAATAL